VLFSSFPLSTRKGQPHASQAVFNLHAIVYPKHPRLIYPPNNKSINAIATINTKQRQGFDYSFYTELKTLTYRNFNQLRLLVYKQNKTLKDAEVELLIKQLNQLKSLIHFIVLMLENDQRVNLKEHSKICKSLTRLFNCFGLKPKAGKERLRQSYEEMLTTKKKKNRIYYSALCTGWRKLHQEVNGLVYEYHDFLNLPQT
jgi:hypothetical protein